MNETAGHVLSTDARHWFIHSFIHLFVRSFIHSFVHPSIHSYLPPFVRYVMQSRLVCPLFDVEVVGEGLGMALWRGNLVEIVTFILLPR